MTTILHVDHVCIITAVIVEFYFFFFNDTATTEIYTLSLHDALPISRPNGPDRSPSCSGAAALRGCAGAVGGTRSEEHTSELQSRQYLVCRLLLEKKKKAAGQQSIQTASSAEETSIKLHTFSTETSRI